MACRLLWRAARAAERSRKRRGQQLLDGQPACAKSAKCRSSSARSPAERSVRSSRSPRTPARAPAHSRCRPTIHEAVSLRAGPSSRASRRRTSGRARRRPSGRARPRRTEVRGFLLFKPAVRHLGIGDLDQGISERMFEHAVDRPAGPASRSAGTAVLSPIRPSASAAARRLCIEGVGAA